MAKKNKVVPCTSANQRAIEHIRLKKEKAERKRKMEEKAMREYLEAYQRQKELMEKNNQETA